MLVAQYPMGSDLRMTDFRSPPVWRSNSLLATVIVVAWLVYSFGLGALYLATPPNPDSSIFDYMSWRGLQGDRLYVDVIEQNWPGAVWVHMLSTAVAGNSLWTFRLLDYLLLVAGCLALYRLGRDSGFTWTSVIVPPLYQMMYVTSTPWLTGQRDAFAAHVLLVVCAAYVGIRGAWRAQWMFLFGMVCAFVVMVRPTYLLFPALIVLGELWALRKEKAQQRKLVIGVFWALAGFLGFLGLLMLVGSNTGGLRGWYEAAILYNLTAYSGSASGTQVLQAVLGMLGMWHWYVVFSIIGIVLWYSRGNPVPMNLMVGIAITSAVSFVVQGKAFGYHLAGVLPVMALFAAQTIAWAIDVMARHRRQLILMAIAAVVLIVAIVGSAKKFRAVQPQASYLTRQSDRQTYLAKSEFNFEGIDMADVLSVTAYIEANTRPEDAVLVWNRAVVINYLAKRRLPVPFATVGALSEFRTEEGLAAQWLPKLRQALSCQPPELIVIGREQNLVDSATGKLHPGQRSKADEIVATAMADRYSFEADIGGARLWRLRKNVELSCQ